jgi:alpha-1,3-mannosyltransferase
MFNDCFAVGAMFLAIYAYQRRMWSLGSLIYSWGVATKMSLLLSLPAVGLILLQAGLSEGVVTALLFHALTMGLVQVSRIFEISY